MTARSAALAVFVLLGACGPSDDVSEAPPEVVARGLDGDAVVFEDVPGGPVIAGGPLDGWLVGMGSGEVLVIAFGGDQHQVVASLPPWQGVDAAAFADGLVVGGVRCASEECTEVVEDLVLVTADGDVGDFAEVDRQPGAPDSAHALDIVGVSDDVLWVRALDGALVGLRPDGSTIGDPVENADEPCVTPQGVFSIATAPVPTTNLDMPIPPQSFTIRELTADGLISRPDATLSEEDSPGHAAYCRDGGFEVDASDGSVARWTPTTGWTHAEPLPASIDAESVLASSPDGTRYYLNADSQLVRLAAGGPVTLPLTFSISRDDSPPFGLAVDETEDVVVACVSTRAHNECRSASRNA